MEDVESCLQDLRQFGEQMRDALISGDVERVRKLTQLLHQHASLLNALTETTLSAECQNKVREVGVLLEENGLLIQQALQLNEAVLRLVFSPSEDAYGKLAPNTSIGVDFKA